MAVDIAAFSAKGRELHYFFPYGLLTPGTIFAHARRPESRRRLIAALRSAVLDDLDHHRIEFMENGLKLYGEAWDYLDNVCIAHSFAELAKPQRVLEIGVRRGMCTVAIASAAQTAELHLVDLWIPNYGQRDNPGPDAIRADLQKIGHGGAVHIHSGDSHQILPTLFTSNPQLEFDLILVDGDHTPQGALQDLKDVFPHLSSGGMLVFDDIAHPVHDYLRRIWLDVIADLGLRVRSAEYSDHGHGVALALRSTF